MAPGKARRGPTRGSGRRRPGAPRPPRNQHDEPFSVKAKPFPRTINVSMPPIHRKLFMQISTAADRSENVLSCGLFFTNSFNTHIFKKCTIHKVEVWTNTVPAASLNQFPNIDMQFFVPGSAAGNWHQSTAPRMEERAALAIVNSKNNLVYQWSTKDTFVKVKTNVTMIMVAVSAVFEI